MLLLLREADLGSLDGSKFITNVTALILWKHGPQRPKLKIHPRFCRTLGPFYQTTERFVCAMEDKATV